MERQDGNPAGWKIMIPSSPHHKVSNRHRGAAHARGFTLVEVVIVVAIAAILLGIGVPSMRNVIITTRIKNASFDAYASILAARSEAITRNTTVTMTPAGGNWAAGWTTTDGGGNTLKTQNAFSNITITSAAATLAFNNTGRLTPAADVQFSLTAPNARPEDGRCITMNLSGRPVVATGVCP